MHNRTLPHRMRQAGGSLHGRHPSATECAQTDRRCKRMGLPKRVSVYNPKRGCHDNLIYIYVDSDLPFFFTVELLGNALRPGRGAARCWLLVSYGRMGWGSPPHALLADWQWVRSLWALPRGEV